MSDANQGCVMVCITDQPGCHALMAYAAQIAKEKAVPLIAITVLKTGLVSEYTADRLQTMYNIAGRHGAQLLVLFNDAPALTVAVAVRQNDAVHLVVGAPGPGSNRFIETIKGIVPEIPLTIVGDDQKSTITLPALSSLG